MMGNENIILCFCKHPEAGLVKSRLAKDLGDDQASSIYKTLLDVTLNNIYKSGFKTFLYCYPDANHRDLKQYANRYPLTLKNQSDGDLGMKMYHAIKDHLYENKNVVLIGSDCLEINTTYIQKAFKLLDSGNELVLGPTEDGGYALIGANKIDASIFQDIEWSSEKVLKQTIGKINKLNLKYGELPIVRDLDTYRDYQYFSSHEKYCHLF